MNIEKQKKLYETGEWVIVHNPIKLGLQHEPSWRIVDTFDCKGDYKLIHQKHKHVLEAYLDGCEVHCFDYKSGMTLETHFIEDYCPAFHYCAVPKSLENCYCENTRSHYYKLLDFSHLKDEEGMPEVDCKVLAVSGGGKSFCNYYAPYNLTARYKQVEFNEQLQNWVYCLKETGDDDTTTTDKLYITNDIHNTMDSDTSEPMNNFEEYGLKPISNTDFEGAILAQVEDKYIGWIRVSKNAAIQACYWYKDGTIEYGYAFHFNLTLIPPKEVYPVFKKNKSGAIFRFDGPYHGQYVLESEAANYFYVKEPALGEECYRDHTDKHWTDVGYDSERGLYHGQPCYMNMGSDVLPCLVLFDTNKTYNKKVNTLTPIPLEALKHMGDFIWEYYQNFIKDTRN